MLYCIWFEKKCGLNEVIPHGTRSVNCRLGLHHFHEYHAYEYSQMNKSMNKVLAHNIIKLGMLYNLSSQASSLIIYLNVLG